MAVARPAAALLLAVAAALAAPAAEAGLRVVHVDAPQQELMPQTEIAPVVVQAEVDCSSVWERRFPFGTAQQPDLEVVPGPNPDLLVLGTLRAPIDPAACPTPSGTALLQHQFQLVVQPTAPARQDLPLELTVRLVGDPPTGDEAVATAAIAVRGQPVLRSDVEVPGRSQSCDCDAVTYTVIVRNQGNVDQRYEVRLVAAPPGVNVTLPAPFSLPRLRAGEEPSSATVTVGLTVPPAAGQATFALAASAVGHEGLRAADQPFTVAVARDTNRFGDDDPLASLAESPAPAGPLALLLLLGLAAARRQR